MKTLPSPSLDTTSGDSLSAGATASVFGRLIGMESVSSGAVTMNTTSSTSITSTSGVTLISLRTSSLSWVENAISDRLLHRLSSLAGRIAAAARMHDDLEG